MAMTIYVKQATPTNELAQMLSACSSQIVDRISSINTGFRGVSPFRDPDLRKHLERIDIALVDLARLHGERALSDSQQERLSELLHELGRRAGGLDDEAAESLLYRFEMFLVEVGDAQVLCPRIEDERHWKQGQTSWLTWDALFGNEPCAALTSFRKGLSPAPADLNAARQNLRSLYYSRNNDSLAHRSRADTRADNLKLLSGILVPLLAAGLALFALASANDLGSWELAMLAVAGALGATISGTMKARDRLTRQSDISRFRTGLAAQLLVGAAFAILVFIILDEEIVQIAGLSPGSAGVNFVIAFLAGFSEPFALGTIERAAKLGQTADSQPPSS